MRDCFLQPVSATPASVLRTLANPSNRCAVSEPLSARPASALRTLANPYWRRLNERLPCVRGGGPRSGGRVVKNNPSPPAAELPLHKGAVIIPDNQSFFCLLFFSKKSTVISVLLLSRRCRPRPSCRCGNSQCACRSGGKPERLCGGLPCPFRV